MLLSLISCSDEKESQIEYDYSKITTHHYESPGLSIPIAFEKICKSSSCLIEFTVSGDYRTEQRDLSPSVTSKLIGADFLYDFAVVPVSIDKIIFQKEGVDVSQFDELWLLGAMNGYQESFVKGGRFIAFATVLDKSDPEFKDVPMDLSISKEVFFVDENEKLVPFFDIDPFMFFKDVKMDDFINAVTDIRNDKENDLAESIKQKEAELYSENFEDMYSYYTEAEYYKEAE